MIDDELPWTGEPARDTRARATHTIDVVVDDVLFLSADGRFAVILATDDHGRSRKAVGDLGQVRPGETLRLRGLDERHTTHGERFAVESFAPILPTTATGIARYLGSGLVPGIGKSLAERLVGRFGDRTLEVIATESVRLREVSGIGRKRADAIADAVRSRQHEAQTLSFLHGLGLGRGASRRILEKLGADTVRLVKDDPYLVAERIKGIGFLTADRIGLAAGIARDDPRRSAGALLHGLRRAADDGHMFLPEPALREATLALGLSETAIDLALVTLAGRGAIVREEHGVYLGRLHAAETAVAKLIGALIDRRPATPAGAPSVSPDAGAANDDGSPALSDDQRAAVEATLHHGLMVLTGGPGTGKTTTVRAIVEAQEQVGRRVLLCAPTGRAAKRLSEATGRDARTIHRLLEWNPGTGGFKRGADDPLEAEVILCDEASMIDMQLGESLLSAIGAGCSLVLVGDVDQLPPVGPGPLLREVIDSGQAPMARLSWIFRQAQQSAIVRGAHEILGGHAPTPSPKGVSATGDLHVIRSRDPDTIIDRLVESLRRMPRAYGMDPRYDLQVLSPMRRGPLGTDRLNAVLQAELNPTARPTRTMAICPGDKVMQLRNDYERDVYNGDLGRVIRVEGGITFIEVDGRELQYEGDDLDALTLAYACTVHKVQGSEFPGIALIMHGGHHLLLTRSLLYTAVTRAKRLALLIGDDRAIERAARNAAANRTHCHLAARLAERAHSP